MCGIAGYLGRSSAEPSLIEAQLSRLRHRGPDSSGWFARGPGVIGQTRLAVVDLITGDPPITAGGGRLGVALNGEIYNYVQLRSQLHAGGHDLKTVGDTEVIAHLAEDLTGPDVARALEGMFAFAVWDERRELLTLGRDRLGKKPLYYGVGPEWFVFASEIKALVVHPAVTRRLDTSVIQDYLTFGYVPTPRTFFEGVCSVPPGHVLTVGLDMQPRIERYWELPIPRRGGVSHLELTRSEAASGVRRHLADAVGRRLMADVPLGAFLSGGVDSSAVVSLMAEQMTTPVKTFTIGFEDSAGFDERPHAQTVAQHLGTDHTEFVVSPNAVDLVDEIVWHHDQPFGDSSAIPTYLLSELTRRHVTVALAGDGGDELFAGYERFAAGVAAGRLYGHGGGTAARLMTQLTRIAPSPRGGRIGQAARFMDAAGLGLPEAFRRWITYTPDDLVRSLGFEPDRSWAIADYRAIWEESAGARTLDRLLNLNMRTYLLDDLLPKVDRMSMAQALEVRTPFLDRELVEFAVRVPPELKVRGLSLKRCLKDAFRDVLPPEILRRPKRGFGVPLDRWFRQELSSYVSSTLGAPSARLRAHVDPAALDRILLLHATGQRNLGHALWTLLTLELFLRRMD